MFRRRMCANDLDATQGGLPIEKSNCAAGGGLAVGGHARCEGDLLFYLSRPRIRRQRDLIGRKRDRRRQESGGCCQPGEDRA